MTLLNYLNKYEEKHNTEIPKPLSYLKNSTL